jgi:hypothetical protein
MLLAAYLRAAGVRGRALGAREVATLGAMITRSDNDAATSFHGLVGGDGLTAVARRAGMRDFVAAPAWGASRLTAADGSRLMLRFDRLVPRRHRTHALTLLARIVPEQRWGVADAAPRGWRLHCKGGRDPPRATASAVNHQIALLRRGRRRVAIAILTPAGEPRCFATDDVAAPLCPAEACGPLVARLTSNDLLPVRGGRPSRRLRPPLQPARPFDRRFTRTVTSVRYGSRGNASDEPFAVAKWSGWPRSAASAVSAARRRARARPAAREVEQPVPG